MEGVDREMNASPAGQKILINTVRESKNPEIRQRRDRFLRTSPRAAHAVLSQQTKAGKLSCSRNAIFSMK